MRWFSLQRDFQGLFSVVPALAFILFWRAAHGATLDTTFTPNISGTVSSIAVQDDGKIVIGGSFNAVNATAASHLARLNANGSLDQTFQGSAPAQAVYAVKVTGSHVFVGAGDGIRRYTREGTLEWHYPLSVKTFMVDAENRVVFGGQFSRVDFQPHRNIARLNANGTLDSTFTAQVGCCAGEGVFALEAHGNAILAGGAFQSVNGAAMSHLALLAGDGELSAGFAGNATPSVLAFASSTDGTFIRVSERTIARHLADGSIDPSFTPFNAVGMDDRFTAAISHPDGSTIMGGRFSAAESANVVRLNASGIVDSSFNLQPNGSVNAVAVDADGLVLIGGAFTAVNGNAQLGIARVMLTSETEGLPRLNVSAKNGQLILSWPANAGSYVLQTQELNSQTWTDASGASTATNGWNYSVQPISGAGRLYRLRQ